MKLTHPQIMHSLRIVTLSAVLAVPCISQAALIFDNPATSNLVTNDDSTSNTFPADLSGFTFYGTSISSIRTSSNGVIQINAQTISGGNYGNSTSISTTSVLAPAWNDLNVTPNTPGGTGVRGSLSAIGGTNYNSVFSFTAAAAFTYSGGIPAAPDFAYQVSLFNANTTVTNGNGNQFSFLAGDIAMSYNAFVSPRAFAGGNAFIGVGNGAGQTAYFPGSGTGGAVSNISSLPTGETFVLYRWNSNTGNYDASLQTFTAIPEPSALSLAALTGCVALLRRRRR